MCGAVAVATEQLASCPIARPLGTDTLRAIADKNAYVAAESEQWRALAVSTDFATASA